MFFFNYVVLYKNLSIEVRQIDRVLCLMLISKARDILDAAID